MRCVSNDHPSTCKKTHGFISCTPQAFRLNLVAVVFGHPPRSITPRYQAPYREPLGDVPLSFRTFLHLSHSSSHPIGIQRDMIRARATLYIGGIVHSLSLDELAYYPRGLLFVGVDGTIEWLEEDVPAPLAQEVAASHGVVIGDDAMVAVVELESDQFLCPGLIDTHTHAPQYPNVGLGQEYQLLDWLDQITFPTESKYSDVEFANQVYEEVVKRNLNAGTTTCCYYGSLHGPSTEILADTVHRRGQRALVGKCNMDRNCPDHYRETSHSKSIEDTKALIGHIRSLPTLGTGSRLVEPVLTPRFAISCSNELLSELGELAKSDPTLAIQTHLSENAKEISFTQKLFPESSSYTDVYDSFGLLRPGTILAHCVHLSGDERTIIKRTGAGVSHCPSSNSNLSSGMANVGKLLDDGIKVGLGTDCSGGYSIGILSQIRQASFVSKMITFNNAAADNTGKYAGKALSIATLFYLATLGGASVARVDDRVGNFVPGKEFDALLVHAGRSPGMFVFPDPTGSSPGSKIGSKERLKVLFEKWLFTSDDRDLHSVFVQGRRVGGVGPA